MPYKNPKSVEAVACQKRARKKYEDKLETKPKLLAMKRKGYVKNPTVYKDRSQQVRDAKRIQIMKLINDKQGGLCALCGKRETTKNRVGNIKLLAQDHCHTTGLNRDYLCFRCNNKILGGANDDPILLRKAADYIEKWKRIHDGLL